MLESTGFLGRIYTVMEWITRIAYINILWILFTLLGLFIFGLAPATVSMFTVIRKWVKGNTDGQVFPTFFNTYRSEFIRSNLLLWPIIIAGCILYIDFQYLTYFQGPLYVGMLFIFINVTIIYSIILLYLFPVYVHFDYKLLQNYKYALLIGISKPFISLSMIVSLLIIGLILERFLGLIPFFSVSLAGFVIMWFAHRAFFKIEYIHH